MGAKGRLGSRAMLRFSIRELLLLTALAATWTAWRLDNARRELSQKYTRAHAAKLRDSLEAAKGIEGMLIWSIQNPEKGQCWQVPHPDWNLISQPIP